MSLLNKLIGSLGFLCVFGCSNSNDEKERQELLKWLNHQIIAISENIEADIELEKKGFYVHQGKTDYASKGYIEYTLKEKTGARLDVSQHSLLKLNDIKNTDGYQQLAAKANHLNLLLKINEVNVDGDEVESYEELDEYIDDIPRYFVITLSGWAGNRR